MTNAKAPFLVFSAFLLAAFISPPAAADGPEMPTLYVYAWEGAFSPAVVRRFESERGCRVEIDGFDSGDEMYEKVRRPGSGYDLIVPTSGMAEQLSLTGMAAPLDHGLLPHLKFISSRVLSLFPDEAMRYQIPYTVTAICVAYNRTMVPPEAATSWDIFEKPGFEDKAFMMNGMRFVMGAALKRLGYSANSTNPDEIAMAGRILRRWNRNVAMFSVERARDALVEGKLAFGQTFVGGMLSLIQENGNLSYFMPKEGSIVASDCFVIPADSAEPELAHAFIDYMLVPMNAAENMNHGYYYMPNPMARDLMEPAVRDSTDFKVPFDLFMKCESIRDVGKATAIYDREWLAALLDGE